MNIDTHSHWMPEPYVQALEDHAERDPSLARGSRMMLGLPPDAELRTLEPRLEQMESAGIDVSVLSLPPPGVFFGSRVDRAETASRVNDALVEAASNNRGQFCVLAALPLPHVKESLQELDRLDGERSVRGVGLLTGSVGWTLDDPALDEVYARVTERGLPVVLHPQMEDLPSAYQDWMLFASLGPVVSSSLGTLRLILSGTLDRVPELVPIVPHLGATLPYLSQRLDDLSGAGDAQHPVSHYLRERLYYDTCSYHGPALRCAYETVGAGRLMLGTDYPFRGQLVRAVRDIEASGLSSAEQRAMLGETAARWFGVESGSAPVGMSGS